MHTTNHKQLIKLYYFYSFAVGTWEQGTWHVRYQFITVNNEKHPVSPILIDLIWIGNIDNIGMSRPLWYINANMISLNVICLPLKYQNLNNIYCTACYFASCFISTLQYNKLLLYSQFLIFINLVSKSIS